MSESLYALAVLACPVGMGAMMWFMSKGMRSRPEQRPVRQPSSVTDLRTEQRRLEEEIDRLESTSNGHSRRHAEMGS